MAMYEFDLNNGKKLICAVNGRARFHFDDLNNIEQEHPEATSGKKFVLRDVTGRRVGFWYLEG